MLRSRIFWRVLLAFLVVNALTAILFVAVLRPVLNVLNDPRERFQSIAEQAVAEYERLPSPEFIHWQRRSNRRLDVHATLLDANGKPVLARFPRGLGAARPLIESGRSFARLPGGRTFLTISVAGEQGSYRWAAIIPRRKDARQQRIALTLRVMLSVLVIALASWWLSRWLVRPLQHLSATAKALGGGDLSARAGDMAAQRSDEVGELARNFNHMAEQTQAMLTARNRLLGDVSHELRSPLARLNVALELARDGGDAEQALGRIERESQRMDLLIGQALEAARAQGMVKAADTVDLPKLVREAIADLQYEFGDRLPSIKLTLPDAATIQGSEELLRRALQNVLRNAAHYGAEGTSIDVILDRTAGELRLRVRDYGPGVPSSELGAIFEPFYRTATARDRASGGHGLGLAIVAEAIAQHGGRAWAERPEGGGLAVVMILPS